MKTEEYMSRSNQVQSIHLSSRFDIPVVPAEGGRRHLVVELVPPARHELGARRQPLEVAFVVDVSGSMGGGKLEAVKEALARIGAALPHGDRVSLVSFSSDVRVHVANAHCDAAGRAAFLDEVERLATRGSTDLAAGWLAGCGLVLGAGGEEPTAGGPGSTAGAPRADAEDPRDDDGVGAKGDCPARGAGADQLRVAARHGSHRRAVVLLSDGQANQGVVDPERLAGLAGDLAKRGVPTTCIGVGADYSTRQLGAISDASGGRFHHAHGPEQIVEILLGELEEHEQIVATQLLLEVSAKKGVAARVLGPVKGETRRGVHRALVGSLSRGAPRKIVVAMDFPPGEAGRVHEVRVRLVGVDHAGDPLRLRAKASIAHGDCAGLAPSEADVVLVTRRMADWLGQQALNLNEAGDFQAVFELRDHHESALRVYASASSEAFAMAELALDHLSLASQAMDDSLRKQRYVRARKSLHEERDLRRMPGEQP
jgi:Ca-activated chloride channel family protein